MSFFKKEDFKVCDSSDRMHPSILAADVANKLLEERGVRVYGNKGPYDDVMSMKGSNWTSYYSYSTHTRQALLINIEELKKKECEHTKLDSLNYKTNAAEDCLESLNAICKCGVKLKATWEPV